MGALNMNESVINYLDNCYKTNNVIDQSVNKSIRTLFLQYLCVGGMPEAVNVFVNSKDMRLVYNSQKNY